MGKKVAMWKDCVDILSPRQPPSHPKPLILLSPNPFSVDGHTCSKSCLTVGGVFVTMRFLKLSTQGDLSDAECEHFFLTNPCRLGINHPTKHRPTTPLPRAGHQSCGRSY